jgi:hypothetical protein
LVKIENINKFNAYDFVGATVLSGNANIEQFTIQESDIDDSGNIIAIDENRLFVFVEEGKTATWTSNETNITFSEGIWIPAWTYLNNSCGFSAGIDGVKKEEIVQLDEKYIPDTIARALTADDAMGLLMEMGVITPMATYDGYVLTDENGYILNI